MSAFSPFSVAPMMDWSDRHCRYFHRLLSRHARLYTEMVTTGAIIYGDKARHLDFSKEEHPIALQLGGSDPKALAECIKMAQDWGYDEINLNCGCPSDRVQNGRFGACLMAEPDLVAEGVHAMKAVTSLPITVKCRIGIDDQDSEADLNNFVTKINAAGVDALTVHARKAWLSGLSPKENRDIPPLDYGRVFRLKANFPHLPIILNGGIKTPQEGLALMQKGNLQGVMLGRAAYQDPFILLDVDPLFHQQPAPLASLDNVFEPLCEYIERNSLKLSHVTRHILGLYQNVPAARAFRRYLSENAVKADADTQILKQALLLIQEARVKVVV
jgi:tRNA-dihydrouridine synthase A